MKVQQLSLANFRGFEQIDLTFEPVLNVIAGVNGVGKSSILQALAVLFSRALPEFTPSTTKPLSLSDEDISYAKAALAVSAIFTVADQQCHMGIQRLRQAEAEGDRWNSFWQARQTSEQPITYAELLAGRTLTGDLEATGLERQRMLNALKAEPNQPQVIYFSTKRQLHNRPRTLPRLQPFEIANAYPRALEDRDVELRDFMPWFRVMETRPLTQQSLFESAESVLDQLRAAVTAFIPEFTNLHIEEEPNLRFVVEKAGTPFALHQLSDGERGLLAIIFDITRRLAIANPAAKNPIAEGKAIILIDEIELHLHPLWQRQVLRRFRETFPNCQFIVTTHSPQVIGEVESRSIRFLLRENGKVIPWTPPRSLGLDSSRVLEELMDVKARNAEIEADLGKLFQLIDDEAFAAAYEQISALSTKLGEDDPELTRARTLISFLEDGA